MSNPPPPYARDFPRRTTWTMLSSMFSLLASRTLISPSWRTLPPFVLKHLLVLQLLSPLHLRIPLASCTSSTLPPDLGLCLNGQSKAAYFSQRVPQGRVRAIARSPSSPRPNNRGFAVFYGRIPGYYQQWHGPQGAHAQVTCVSGALCQGYETLAEARATYNYGCSRNWTGVRGVPAGEVRPIESLPVPIVPDDPTPNPLHGAVGARTHRWHIMYAGITPGIYLSFLEAALNTQGISGSRYDSATSLHEARRRWRVARENNFIEILNHPYH
ncbi:hypothetical protein B0H13DRAFT_2368688 [Mycena leptocephala]|nr:hypothetical protein B0H13DRAFT_2368688 [Mycena leptocephala]